ncbi:formate dehydrogenase accessory sulfurtransferase FdhD [soil metagenome]
MSASTSVQVLRLGPSGAAERPDRVVTEAPLQVRVAPPAGPELDVAVTLRTPGHDTELAVGLLRSEGLLPSAAELGAVRAGADVVTVTLRRALGAQPAPRSFLVSASCGACGKTSVSDIAVDTEPLAPGPVVAASVVVDLPERLRASQRVFERTGGLHAAGRFGPTGAAVVVREDVGRHNAVDKVIGAGVLAGGMPLADEVLVVSGRVSFEIVQKAAVAGLAVVVAVSAPSSLAVVTARRLGLTLVCFVRDGSANVYTGRERSDLDA